MSLPKKGVVNNISNLNIASKSTNLNPNAAEFVPFSLKSPSGSTSTGEVAVRRETFGTSGKGLLEQTESTVSDEEAHQYWCRQLPDDITPDFKFMGEDESEGPDSLSFANLSILDRTETSMFFPSTDNGQILSKQQEISSQGSGTSSLFGKMKYSALPYVQDHSSAGFLNLPHNPWDKNVVDHDHSFGVTEENYSSPYNGNSSNGTLDYMFNVSANMDGSEVSALDLLATEFPGFAAESLAEVYYANGCDLSLTIEMLTQLELQVDGGFSQTLNSKTLSAPNLSAMDFPAHLESDSQNALPKYAGDDLQQISNPYRSVDKENILLFRSSSSASPRGAVDFASAVKKLASQDSGQWKYERNGTNATTGSSRNSHVLTRSYSNGHGKPMYGDRLASYSSARVAPVWLETGEAVANMCSELREEAHDYARLGDAYFEQAGHPYLVGNKALAKDLSMKGQLHNMQMKAAHEKAQESIYNQRNSVALEQGRGQERIIDLHGLHLNEAIQRLRTEMNVLRSAARNFNQRLELYICVGTGHHTQGSRTPARLPVAVEQYLLQEEGLDYTEPQPGLLRVLIY